MAAKVAPTCIECWDPKAIVTVMLNGIDDEKEEATFHCLGCKAEFNPSDVLLKLNAMRGWTRIIAWVAAMPNE